MEALSYSTVEMQYILLTCPVLLTASYMYVFFSYILIWSSLKASLPKLSLYIDLKYNRQ